MKTKTTEAEVVREYGPFEKDVHGVTFDGENVWFATGESIQSFAPSTGESGRAIEIAADAGTAYDGEHFFQIGDGVIQKIEPHTGKLLGTIPSPAAKGSAGLTWAEGKLWVAHHRERKIHQIDPTTGKILRTIESTRFVTGVTFVEGELWHGTWENNESELRRVSPETGEVLESISMPAGKHVSGLESNGQDLFYCGGGPSKTVRAVRRPSSSASSPSPLAGRRVR